MGFKFIPTQAAHPRNVKDTGNRKGRGHQEQENPFFFSVRGIYLRKNSIAAWVRKHQLFRKAKVKCGEEENQKLPTPFPAPTQPSSLKIQFEELIFSEGFLSDALRHDKKRI